MELFILNFFMSNDMLVFAIYVILDTSLKNAPQKTLILTRQI